MADYAPGRDVAGPMGRVGSVLKDKWRIDAKLAQGGVATVYAATHKIGSRVAVKILHPEFARNPDVKARFLREGYVANSVGHPGVVQVLYDDTTDQGEAFIVMELLEGELLEGRRMRLGGRLPLPEVFDFGDQLLDVLDAAHSKGIIHRDIKPENLFVVQERVLKVLDFGVAQMRQALGFGAGGERTATGMLLGTPEFMPPEQVLGYQDQVDAQSDIWAVGATLFVLLSGQNPHAAETISQFLIAAASQPARTLGSVAPWVPPPMCSVIDRALAFDKPNRWATARAMRDALEQVRGGVLGNSPSGRRQRMAPMNAPLAQGTMPMQPQRPPPVPRPKTAKLVGPPPPPPPSSDFEPAVPSTPEEDERTIAAIGPPGGMRDLDAPTDRPPRPPSSPPISDDGPTRVGALMTDPSAPGRGIDPYDVTTLAPGDMLRMEDLEAALSTQDEATLSTLGTLDDEPDVDFAPPPPRPNTSMDRRPPPPVKSAGKPPPPPQPPRPMRPRQASVPDFGSNPPDFGGPLPNNYGQIPGQFAGGPGFPSPHRERVASGLEFAPPPPSFREPMPSAPDFGTSAGIPSTPALVGGLGGPAIHNAPQQYAPPPMRASMPSYQQAAMVPGGNPGQDPRLGGAPFPQASLSPSQPMQQQAPPQSQMQTHRRQLPPTMMVRAAPQRSKTLYILGGVGGAFVLIWVILFAAWRLTRTTPKPVPVVEPH